MAVGDTHDRLFKILVTEPDGAQHGSIGRALDAFIRGDGALGRAVCASDDAVDALHDSVFRILVTHMMEDPRAISPAMELFLVSRNLERVADMATNIGEDAVFLAEGKQIKHHFEERSSGTHEKA